MATTIFAQEVAIAEKNQNGFFLRNDAAYYIKGGSIHQVQGIQDLGNGVSINALGVISRPNEKPVQLKNGQLADFNGNIFDNQVEEFIEMQNGIAVIITNGIVTPIENMIKLSDGSFIDQTGTTSNGTMLSTGNRIKMDGSEFKK
jgi:hypothetical protein